MRVPHNTRSFNSLRAASALIFVVLVAWSALVGAQPVPAGGLRSVTTQSEMTGSGTSSNPLGLRTTCDAAQVLQWNGSTWACATVGIADGDKGDLTVTGGVWTLDTAVVTFAKMADLATGTFIGRVTAGTGAPEVLTGTQATTLLDVFTSGLKGLAPASGGGTSNYLRADGTWAAPTSTVGAGSITTTELADNLDLSANGSTTVGDLRGTTQTDSTTGTVNDLYAHFGIDAAAIANAATGFVGRNAR